MSTVTGVLRGKSFFMSRSGKTTSVAQVLSVVRTNVTLAFDPGAPRGMASDAGLKPCWLATTRSWPVTYASIDPLDDSWLASGFLPQAGPIMAANATTATAATAEEAEEETTHRAGMASAA